MGAGSHIKGCNVSMVQSAKIKEYGKTGELTLAMVRLILTEEKPKERKEGNTESGQNQRIFCGGLQQ